MTGIVVTAEGSLLPIEGGSTDDHVIEQQHHDCTDDCYKHAVNVEAGHTGCSELVEEKTADYRSHNPKNDVKNEAFASLVDDLAANESGN